MVVVDDQQCHSPVASGNRRDEDLSGHTATGREGQLRNGSVLLSGRRQLGSGTVREKEGIR